MVGHFHFQHPCLFLLINQLHHKVLIISDLIVSSQQPHTFVHYNETALLDLDPLPLSI